MFDKQAILEKIDDLNITNGIVTNDATLTLLGIIPECKYLELFSGDVDPKTLPLDLVQDTKHKFMWSNEELGLRIYTVSGMECDVRSYSRYYIHIHGIDLLPVKVQSPRWTLIVKKHYPAVMGTGNIKVINDYLNRKNKF